MAGGMEREPMLEMFLFETNQMIEQLEEITIHFEKTQKLGQEEINEIFRIMHSLKSSSAMMMFDNISKLAHAMEDMFFFIRENKQAKVEYETLSDLVLSGLDFIRGEIDKIENGKEADRSPEELISRVKRDLAVLKDNLAGGGTAAASAAPPEPEKPMIYISSYKNPAENLTKYSVRMTFEPECQMENVRAYMAVHGVKEIAAELWHIPEDIVADADSSTWIRDNGFLLCFATEAEPSVIEEILSQGMYIQQMDIQQVEEFPPEIQAVIAKAMGIVVPEEEAAEPEPAAAKTIVLPEGEKEEESSAVQGGKKQSIISVSLNKLDVLMDLVGEIVISEAMVTRNPDLDGLQLDRFNKAALQLRKLTKELQDVVMSVRMVPLSTTFQKMNRIVRDMGKKLDKEVELEIIGETTEVDKNIIDNLSDPLIHLIRNSMDHGLESREIRAAAGKNKRGKITLEARNAGGDVWIIVRDDGKGLDREKILHKAREHGLVAKSDHEMSDREVFSLILLPGFSTKENVSEFSGRGVGMDVVKKNIEKIGGTIAIESVKGRGTEMLIKIPLTLAIIDGIEIGVGKSSYMVPTTSIKESFKTAEKDLIIDPDGNEAIMIRGKCYPVFRMHRIFGIREAVHSIDDGIMVMVEGDNQAACLFADKLMGEQQVVVKALPRYVKKVSGIAGCTILGNGSISLIVDVNGILAR